MAEIEPPSFSLGLDFDLEPSNIHNTSSIPPSNKNLEKGKEEAKEDEDQEDEFNLRVSDSETDSPENSTLTRFRRLRRGGPSLIKPISTPISNSVDDDDIEDFSDDEGGGGGDNVVKNDHLAPHHHASCSSSKLPLSGCGVLMRQPGSATQRIKRKQDSSCPSTNLGSSKGKSVFSDFTSSPLRRFQLLDCESDPDDPSIGVRNNKKSSEVEFSKSDRPKESGILARFKLLDSESDSDDSSNGEQINRKASSVDFLRNNNNKESEIQARFNLLNSAPDVCIDREASSVDFAKTNKVNEAKHGSHKNGIGKYKDSLPPISQKQDLWQDFCVIEERPVQTPAFDEFCDEYFKTVQSSKPAPDVRKFCSSEPESRMNNSTKTLQPQNSESAVPPSHRYFFHEDSRIQKLVRSRLPNFSPLSTSGDAGYEIHNASSIDYMSQFGQDAKRQTGSHVTVEKNSNRGRKRTKISNIEDTSLGSENWINPKQTASTPKDAGRRRVLADGQSAGRWCTTENGKKVYVTKNGKEMTGQLAYRHYRKESGRGFSKSRKKGAAKKK